jgi:hypothetical protein
MKAMSLVADGANRAAIAFFYRAPRASFDPPIALPSPTRSFRKTPPRGNAYNVV